MQNNFISFSICSWTRRKLLKLRPKADNLIQHIIGNGQATSLWWENWHPLGPLIKKYGRRLLYDTQLGENAKVEEIIAAVRWNWPGHSTAIQHIIRHTPIDFHPNLFTRDKIYWIPDKRGIFTVKSCWEAFRKKGG